MRLGQPGAAVAAVKEKGVLTGLRVERSERLQRNVNDLSDDELVAIAQGKSTIELNRSELSWPQLSHRKQ